MIHSYLIKKEAASFEFHISKKCRVKYQIDDKLFTITGNLIVANSAEARKLASKINDIRKKNGEEDKLITAGQINALGLLHEIFHFLIRTYEESENPGVFSRGIKYLTENLGSKEVDKIMLKFIEEFPPLTVYKNNATPIEYLNGSTKNKSNKEIILEEIILLQLENSNPASRPLEELYSDKELAKEPLYLSLIDHTENFFITEKSFGSENLPLMQFLRKPLTSSPYSLDGQLEFIREKWGVYIYEVFNERLLGGKDLIYEDAKLFIHHGGGEKATPPIPVYKFDKEYYDKIKAKISAGDLLTEEESSAYKNEPEHFTQDTEWMPKVVMIAKNIFVWLHQLSKKYEREIKTIDQIPDEELDTLQRWNFTSLWLIGIWERSSASQKIKNYTGNPEAASSAYSLFDYVIADELGGEAAFENFKSRAWQRGIRVASDMVPNHTGIYSKWVIEKPDYFIQTNHPPYPNYTFTGPNLSNDGRVEVRIEDKYYSKQDAAVVFERKDNHTGNVRYIYHGNDGTVMPWNDTAQLNLLNPEARESLIQTIMHVARKTPIIRFDAAMTLAKRHYQRLWFPEPGKGGAIPSRSDYSMTLEAFNNAMPVEFWREVVDRINNELPNTLLLAEAFWMMESYFVRTLGMHRVYNSAFMHMLMKEENDKYRQLIKNTMEFNPEILKRYVNFMSNPDEETALNQFGKGDKYFGVLVLMVTLPGLPMFAHGQIEGFSEKYGMEYKRSYYDEHPDHYHIERHEREIFPLMNYRQLFSQSDNFQFYDYLNNSGEVIESVYAYSNRDQNKKALILYNNSYSEERGTINYSVQKNESSIKLFEALNINPDPLHFYIYKDHKTNLEHLIAGNEIAKYGMYFVLGAYQYKILLDFREVYDSEGRYQKLNLFLEGKGVQSIRQALDEMELAPFHKTLGENFSQENIQTFITFAFNQEKEKKKTGDEIIPEKIKENFDLLIDELNKVSKVPIDKKEASEELSGDILSIKKSLNILAGEQNKKRIPIAIKRLNMFLVASEEKNRELLFPIIILKNLFHLQNGAKEKNLFDKYLVDRVFTNGFGSAVKPTYEELFLIKTLLSNEMQEFWAAGELQKSKEIPAKIVENIKKSNTAKDYIHVHKYENTEYFSKELFENLLNWLSSISVLLFFEGQKRSLKTISPKGRAKQSKALKPAIHDQAILFLRFSSKLGSAIEILKDAAEQSGYKLRSLEKYLEKKNKKLGSNPVLKKSSKKNK